MPNSLKKAFTFSVVVTTILWSVGLAAFVPVAQAAQSGDLIKASGPAVYYLGANGKRYVFPNEKTFKTWYSNFSSVITITDAELAALPIGGNVTYRPGVKMVKITTDPKVYAVDSNGTLRWIQTEAVAIALYGANWAQLVEDVADSFFTNYTIGSPIGSAADYNKTAVMNDASSINVDKGLSGGSQNTAANVTASVASDSPAGATLPKGALSVPVLKFNLSGSGTITNLTFKSVGVGATNGINAAYLYEGATRLTSGKSLNSTTKEVTFNVNWNLSGTKTYTVVIDVAPGAASSDQHQFTLTAINGAALTGVTGSLFTIGSQTVSDVQIQKLTTPTNPKVGSAGVEIANFKLTGGANDAWVHAVTITQSGSINVDQLKNFVLKQGTTTVATTASISGDKIVLPFSTPFSLLSGANREFRLYADVADRPGRTISTYLDENTDLKVTDALFGFGASVTNTNYSSASPMTLTTEGGDLTIAFNGPVTGDVSKGAQDVVLFKFAMTPAAPVEVRNWYLKIEGPAGGFVKGSAGTNYFTDIKIRRTDTGATVAGPISIPGAVANSATDTGYLTLTDDYTVTGTTNFEVTADLANTEDNGADDFFGEAYRVVLGNGTNIFGANDVKYEGSNDFIATGDIVPNTPITGNQQTIRQSSLSVGTSSYIGDSTHVKGAMDAQVVAFSLTAGSDSNVKVTKFTVDPRVDTDASGVFGNDNNANTVIASATLWRQNTDGSVVKLDGPRAVKGALGAETIAFENFADTIAAGNSVLYIVSTTFTTTAGAGNNDGVIITIQNATNITAEDKDNNSVTAVNAGTGNAIDSGANAVNDTDGAAGVTSQLANVEATVKLSGNFYLSADTSDSQYKERLVQMGSQNQKILRVKAKGTDEAFTATDIRVTIDGNPADISSVTLTYPTNQAQTTFESKTSALVGGIAQFSGLNWFITKDVDSYATVTANINTDTNGASSDQSTNADAFRAHVDAQDADHGTSPAVIKVIGQSSGSTVDATANINNADANGNYVYARKTIVTFSKHATSPSGTNVAPGVNDYLIFTIANGSGGVAEVSALTFKVSGGDGQGHDWVCGGGSVDSTGIKVYDTDNLSTNLVTGYDTNEQSGLCAGDNKADAAFYTVYFGTPISISAGATKTFKVQADTTGASGSDDDAFRIDLVAEVDGTADDASGGGYPAMEWNDGINTVNGYKVENLPITGGNFSF